MVLFKDENPSEPPGRRYKAFCGITLSHGAPMGFLTSPDGLRWTLIQHLYTNAVTPYFRAPHLYVGFPKRYAPDRQVVIRWTAPIGGQGCADAVFMNSRDGLHWDRRFVEAFLRPGLDVENWTDRNLAIAPGVVQTGPGEMSLYYIPHYAHGTCVVWLFGSTGSWPSTRTTRAASW